jgi:hypothetical protein
MRYLNSEVEPEGYLYIMVVPYLEILSYILSKNTGGEP